MQKNDEPGVHSNARLQVERWLEFAGLLTCAAGFCYAYLRALAPQSANMAPIEFSIGLVWGVVYPAYVAALVLGRLAVPLRAPLFLFHNPALAIFLTWIARRDLPVDLLFGSVCGFAIGMAVGALLDASPRKKRTTGGRSS